MTPRPRRFPPKKTSAGGDAALRGRILDQAREHFFAHGFRGVTMDDLAEELAMSKKTLYANFMSKRSLLEAVLALKHREISRDLKTLAAKNTPDFPEALRQFLDLLQRHTRELQPSFVRDIQREAPDLFKRVEQWRRLAIRRAFGRILAIGKRSPHLRKDLPIELIVEILLGTTDAIVNPVKLGQFGLTPEMGYRAVISVIFEGVITRPHDKIFP